MEGLTHPRRRHQMLQLQRDLRMLLRYGAALERVGELRLFPNAEQQLRLRHQTEARHPRRLRCFL